MKTPSPGYPSRERLIEAAGIMLTIATFFAIALAGLYLLIRVVRMAWGC